MRRQFAWRMFGRVFCLTVSARWGAVGASLVWPKAVIQ